VVVGKIDLNLINQNTRPNQKQKNRKEKKEKKKTAPPEK